MRWNNTYMHLQQFCPLKAHQQKAHQYSSHQKKILKDQSAQTTARVVSDAYHLWLLFLINRVLNLTKLRSVILCYRQKDRQIDRRMQVDRQIGSYRYILDIYYIICIIYIIYEYICIYTHTYIYMINWGIHIYYIHYIYTYI